MDQQQQQGRPRRVSIDETKNQVIALPEEHSEAARLARQMPKTLMRAPKFDELWDGDRKQFREVELTPEQLLHEQFWRGMTNKPQVASSPTTDPKKRKQPNMESIRDEWGTYSFKDEVECKVGEDWHMD